MKPLHFQWLPFQRTSVNLKSLQRTKSVLGWPECFEHTISSLLSELSFEVSSMSDSFPSTYNSFDPKSSKISTYLMCVSLSHVGNRMIKIIVIGGHITNIKIIFSKTILLQIITHQPPYSCLFCGFFFRVNMIQNVVWYISIVGCLHI